jgi:hypothetical protein
MSVTWVTSLLFGDWQGRRNCSKISITIIVSRYAGHIAAGRACPLTISSPANVLDVWLVS